MIEASEITYEQMKGALGSILLLWAKIEKSLRNELARMEARAPPKATHFSSDLDTWKKAVIALHPPPSLGGLLASALCDQLQEPRAVRNGVCHGLTGVTGQLDGKAPASLSWNNNGVKGSIAWNELQASLCWLSKVPTAISAISRPHLDSLGSRTTDTVENRRWWVDEHGLDLRRGTIELSESH